MWFRSKIQEDRMLILREGENFVTQIDLGQTTGEKSYIGTSQVNGKEFLEGNLTRLYGHWNGMENDITGDLD